MKLELSKDFPIDIPPIGTNHSKNYDVWSVCNSLDIQLAGSGRPYWLPRFVDWGTICGQNIVQIENFTWHYSIWLLSAALAYLAPFYAVHSCSMRTDRLAPSSGDSPEDASTRTPVSANWGNQFGRPEVANWIQYLRVIYEEVHHH